jgi:hypothetical protein
LRGYSRRGFDVYSQWVKALGALAAAVVLMSAPLALASPTSRVVATIKAEQTAFNQKHWTALWRLHTPKYRATCSYAKYVAAEKRLRNRSGTIKVTGIRITVMSRTRALADYSIVPQAGPKTNDYRDAYAKVGVLWLDELNRPGTAGCGY